MPQKTGLYQFVPTVAFPPPQRLQGKGNPSSPRTRRSMWPILPATSHLRLRSGGFFTPPGGHVRQRFPDRAQSRQTRMKVLLWWNSLSCWSWSCTDGVRTSKPGPAGESGTAAGGL